MTLSPSLVLLSRTRLLILTAALVLTTAQLQAHELRPAIADMSFENERATVSIALNLEAVLAGITPDHDDTDDAPQAERYSALRAQDPDELAAAFKNYEARFLSQVKFGSLSPSVQSLSVPPVGDRDISRESVVTLTAMLPDGTEAVTFRWAATFGPLILRAPGETADEPYSAYLTEGAVSDPIAVTGAGPRGMLTTIRDYLLLGYTHILPKGLDHILFVVGLFLLSARLRPLLWQITSFTLAHTVTLALGIAGIVNISPAIVEPLIAASIVYVCIENILSDRMAAWRAVVVFGFGLLHGLGFAGVLGEIGMPPGQFVTALISFNVGVELGQLTVIALCFLAVGLWFRDKPWYRSRITIPASLVIAMIGAYWCVERVFLT